MHASNCSLSYSKDGAVGVGIWQVPSNLSKKAIKGKLTTMVDKLLALPIAQKNYVKFEMTGLATEELMTHGVSDGPPSVLLTAECATIADYLEILEDPAATSVLQGGINSIYGNSRPTVNLSLGEVQMRLDRSPAAAKNRACLACVLKGPENFSVDGYLKTVNASEDVFVGLSIAQKNVIKHSMWIPHNTMDSQVSAIGFPEPHPNIMFMVETENQDRMIEMLKDRDVKQFVEDSRREWDFHVDGSFFVANVVTKLD
ncbi:hypothetical protein C8R45DRAFT_1137348 [Mycena sanguinolenta]|nr:hypothetical protein C8R45DRAFT_1137348 [Mycena sanguinolenta]